MKIFQCKKLINIFILFLLIIFPLYAYSEGIPPNTSDPKDTWAFLQLDDQPISRSNDNSHTYQVTKDATISVKVTDLPYYSKDHEFTYHLQIGTKKGNADYGELEIHINKGACTQILAVDDNSQNPVWSWSSDLSAACVPTLESDVDGNQTAYLTFHATINMANLTSFANGKTPPKDNNFYIGIQSAPGGNKVVWSAYVLTYTDTPTNVPVELTTNAPTVPSQDGSIFEINQNTPVTFTAKGCGTTGTVNFSWSTFTGNHASSKNNVPINQDGAAVFIKGGVDKTATDAYDPQYFDANLYDSEPPYTATSDNLFKITATCSDGRNSIIGLQIIPTGRKSEIISVDPTTPLRSIPFKIVLKGLAPDTCYYVQIKNNNTQKYIQGPGKGDGSCSTILNDPDVFAASDQWFTNTETSLDVPAQEIADYTAYLRIAKDPTAKSDNDKTATKRKFSVQENPGTPTPFPPPCEVFQTDHCVKFRSGLGSFSTSSKDFINSVLTFLLSISGGIVIILIIRAGYIMLTSRGDPEKIESAKEILTSAIVGLLFIIFSLVILQVITVDLLKIPGFRP